jgi:tRNA threonylcarbamoyl adenosine modification protein YeaZ
MLAEAGLSWPALDALAVTTGPGNFTGLRLAVAAARGLALALGRPAVGVSVFETLADPHPGPLLVTLEDRRDGFFAQAFRDGAATSAPISGDPAGLGPFDPETRCIGFRAGELACRLRLAAGAETTRADPAVLARLAAGRLGRAVPPAPLYLRPADAMPPSDPVPALLDDA